MQLKLSAKDTGSSDTYSKVVDFETQGGLNVLVDVFLASVPFKHYKFDAAAVTAIESSEKASVRLDNRVASAILGVVKSNRH